MIRSSASPRWQTTIADLSLILFLLAASALANPPAASAPRDAGVSLAMWQENAQTPPLEDWLAQQPPDSAQRLAITITYAPGGMARAIRRAEALHAQTQETAARGARITILPGARDGAQVHLIQDAPAGARPNGPDIAS